MHLLLVIRSLDPEARHFELVIAIFIAVVSTAEFAVGMCYHLARLAAFAFLRIDIRIRLDITVSFVLYLVSLHVSLELGHCVNALQSNQARPQTSRVAGTCLVGPLGNLEGDPCQVLDEATRPGGGVLRRSSLVLEVISLQPGRNGTWA